MRGVWTWALSPSHQLLFWWDTDFSLAPPVGKKMLKFTKLFLIALLVNINTIRPFTLIQVNLDSTLH